MDADSNRRPPQDPRTGATAAVGGGDVPYPTAFFGHPRGLATLFFTEMWERFSYYGMRSLLFLFMPAAVSRGGLGFSDLHTGAIYGLYVCFVYLLALPGGWIADRLLGQRRAVLVGGCLIAAGHFSLAFQTLSAFYLGLVLIAVGTGLLKPNVSTMVGELYPHDRARRDAGFSIFYMGINLGAIFGPLVCGQLGEKVNWHLGFAAAGVFMLVGVVQYALGGKYLGEAGLRPNASMGARERNRSVVVLAACVVVALLAALLIATGVVPVTAEQAADGTVFAILGIALAYFLFQLAAGGLDRGEIKRMSAVFILFVFSTLFWCGFEQAGSSLTVFADRLTNRSVFGWEFPASWYQSVEPIFLIAFAPFLAWLWVRLGSRNPSSPTKFAMGLLLMFASFMVMMQASIASVGHAVVSSSLVPHKVSLWWLVLAYLLQALGELCLSPVGLSTVTKLAPHRKVSQMMGIWFMSLALGNLIAGQIGGHFGTFPLYRIFGSVAMVTGAAGLILLLLVRPMRRLIGGAE
jgi:POT family proton-dependent oligopeptide transporter